MKPQAFEPEIASYTWAGAVAVAGFVCGAGLVVLQAPVTAGVVLLGAGFAAMKQYKQGLARQHGMEVEDRYLKALGQECAWRGWALDTDIFIVGIGNLDAVVTTSIGESGAVLPFVVEMKSYWGLSVLPDGRVIRSTGKGLSAERDVQQLSRQVVSYSMTVRGRRLEPVGILWCPHAKRPGTFFLKNAGEEIGRDLLVVNGSLNMLMDTISRETTKRAKQESVQSKEYQEAVAQQRRESLRVPAVQIRDPQDAIDLIDSVLKQRAARGV